MSKIRNPIILLSFFILLSSCNVPPSKTETPDLGEIYTEVAATIIAEFTADAPSFSQTPLPTSTSGLSQQSANTPTSTPPDVTDNWIERVIIEDSDPFFRSIETQEYYLEEIFGSGVTLDRDTKWTFDIQINNYSGYSGSGFQLVGYSKSGTEQYLFLIYNNGYWHISYVDIDEEANVLIEDDLTFFYDSNQHFELVISGDGKEITLTNNAMLEFHRTIDESLFLGAEAVMVNANIGLQTDFTLSNLTISQIQNEEDLNRNNSGGLPDNNYLSGWVDEFVHAYGGHVTVNGIEMDSSQLTDAIRKNENEFIINKNINGVDYQILMVNGSPMAVKEDAEQWQEATMKIFGTLADLKIGSLISNDSSLNTWWGNEYHFGIVSHGLREAMPDRDTIDFGWPNYLIKIAKGNGLDIVFHSGVHPGESPSWMKDGFTQNDLNNIMRKLADYAKSHQADQIIVVNEARIPYDWESPDIFWQKFGIDYVIQAFRTAREIYPEAKLIYNDTANHFWGTFATDTTVLISNTLLEEGLIDYVGIQMHVEPHTIPTKDNLIKIFQSYPVPIVITEFDLLLTYVPENDQDEMLNNVTKIVIEACLESQVCDSFTTWGENDSIGWEGRSLLRDFDNNRKQAYYVAMQAMLEHLP